MSKEVKGVTPELVIETLKLLEPRLVPSENGVIDLNKEVREKWNIILNRIINEEMKTWNTGKGYVGIKGIKYCIKENENV